jgi:hypothetical protein
MKNCPALVGLFFWSRERGAGLGVGVASLMMRGFGDPRARFRAASVSGLEAGVALLSVVLPIAESLVLAADGPAPRSPDR